MFGFISKIFSSITLFRAAFYKYKKKIALLTVLGFLSGILGGIGIGAVIPLFSFISGQEGVLADDPISKIFSRVFSFIGIEFSLFSVVVVLVLLFVFKALFVYAAHVINARSFSEYEVETRRELFKHTMRADWPHLKEHKIGYLSQLIIEDVNASSGILQSISTVILLLTSFITYAIVAIGISFKITLLVVLISIVVFFALKPLFYKIRKFANLTERTAKDISHYVNQSLLGAKSIKSMAAEDRVIKNSDTHFKKLTESRFGLSKYNQINVAFFEPLTLAVILPIFLFSYKDPLFNIASFVAILYLIQKMFSFARSAQDRINVINQLIPQLIAVINYQTEARKHKEDVGGESDFILKESLKFENVSFVYDDSKTKVLDGLSFSIRRGEMVGLIGSSGAGKTTIVDLVLRLFNPTTGKIAVDGTNAADINLKKWRKNIGYVSQDIFLLNDTIANNIRFYDETISDNEVEKAARAANIYDFIIQQPDKFNAFVGERGLKLSAGQRQRIVLARILARNPELLVLDEATSALDNESEASIRQALDGLRGKITMLIIAHRLSTLSSADRLLVLNEGRIVEEGPPKLLLENKDSYFYKMSDISGRG